MSKPKYFVAKSERGHWTLYSHSNYFAPENGVVWDGDDMQEGRAVIRFIGYQYKPGLGKLRKRVPHQRRML